MSERQQPMPCPRGHEAEPYTHGSGYSNRPRWSVRCVERCPWEIVTDYPTEAAAVAAWNEGRTKHEIESVMTASEVAKMLSVSQKTVRRWACDGTLPSMRVSARGDLRFWQRDIEAFLRKSYIRGLG